MKLKSISKFLVFGTLLNNMNINSFASVLSDDTRYETFIGNNITINDILEEDKVNIEVEGNSLVNSIGKLSYIKIGIGNLEDNKFSFTYNNSAVKAYFENSTIKEDTEYTLFYNITKNTLIKDDYSQGSNVVKINLNNSGYLDSGFIYIKEGEVGLFSKVITTSSITNNEPYIETTPSGNIVTGGEFEIKDIILIEGDWTNRDIPEYFEGMQSSFENNLITQEMIDSGEEKAKNLGKYKVEIKSTGKNKFNGKFEVGSIGSDGNNLESDTAYRGVDYID